MHISHSVCPEQITQQRKKKTTDNNRKKKTENFGWLYTVVLFVFYIFIIYFWLVTLNASLWLLALLTEHQHRGNFVYRKLNKKKKTKTQLEKKSNFCLCFYLLFFLVVCFINRRCVCTLFV